MSHIRQTSKRFYRKITGRRQKQPDVPPTTTSADITLGDSSATGSNHAQQEQSRDILSSTSPILPAARPASIAPEDSSATGDTHVQGEQLRDDPPSTYPGNRQRPLAAQSLWDQAYDALAKKMPDLVRDYDELLAKEQMANSALNETTPLQLPAPPVLANRSPRQVQLDTVIQNGLQRMEDNKTTYKIAGHEFVLADQITTAANFLLWGKDWIGSAVKSSPEASLVWSGVCLIFPLLTNPIIATEVTQNGFAHVTSRLRYYVALEPMVRRLGQNARVDDALVSAANDHIVDLYQSVLDFQLSSVLRFYQSRLKTYVRDVLPSKDWEQTLLGIKTREETVNNALGQINDLAARERLEFLNKTSEETRATMEECLSVATQQLTVLKEQLAAQQDAQQGKLLAEQRKEQRSCLQLFCLTRNDGAMYDWYKDRVEPRIEGTCNWFLQHDSFKKWLSQESGPLLVSADPGCGKSVLAKYLIDDGLAQQSATICYFFFKDQDQNTTRQALCALLHQLFTKKRTLIQHAMDLYNDMGEKLVQSDPSLWTILRDAVRDPQAGPVTLVIDALDECDESQLKSFVRNLENIFRDQQLANAKFKVLMTSRPYQHVVNEFYSLQDRFRQIHIPGEEEFEAISQEVNSVIRHRVKQLARKHQLSDEIKSSLDRKLLAIGHRTYLWVYLVFDHLDKGFKTTDDGIDAAIQTLPKSVNQAYDQILTRSQEDETVNTVKKVLSIILAARRPLTLSEMNIAMNLDGQGRGRPIHALDLEKDVAFKSRLRTLCGLFVSVHHNKIYFLHQTAREFLIQPSTPTPALTTVSSTLQWYHSITVRHAHSVLAEVCMFYLDRLNSTHTDTFRENAHQSALLRYSAKYWDDHFREAEFEKGSTMVDIASGICNPDPTSNSMWYTIRPKRYFKFNIGHVDVPNVLMASHRGLTSVTELLLDRGADIEARDGTGYTALMLAAGSRHEAITRLLLENGADVEAEDRCDRGKSVLIIAARAGHEAIARLLLENGANVEARDEDGGTALMFAVIHRREAITRLLLENGADVETRGSQGRTALMRAADSGSEAVTRVLLENGADVEAKDSQGSTALMHAADFGRVAVTRLLLEKGADVDARDEKGRTAIDAAKHGHDTYTQLLLKEGADAETLDKQAYPVLIHVIIERYEAVVQLLLDNGAQAQAKDVDGGMQDD